MSIDPDNVTFEQALKAIQRYCYKFDKKLKMDVPSPPDIKIYLEGLSECMEPGEFAKVVELYGSFSERKKSANHSGGSGQRGRPRGRYYGMTQKERAEAMAREAQAKGVWHLKYPDGCQCCGKKDYGHASGGVCNRCYSFLKANGMGMKEFRAMQDASPERFIFQQ